MLVLPSSPEGERALLAANRFILQKYPLGVTGHNPKLVWFEWGEQRGPVWVVPLALTSPGHGVVGEVGTVLVSDGAYQVVGFSDVDEVCVTLKRLRGEKQREIETAFLQAKKA